MTNLAENIAKKKKSDKKLFLKLDAPSQKSEEWKYTNIKNFDFNKVNLCKQEIVFPEYFQELKQKGIILCNINEAIKKYPEILSLHAPMTLVEIKDKASAMHSAFWNNGFFIYVPENTHVKIPLRGINKSIKKGNSFSHNVIIIEKNSEATFIEEHISSKFEGENFRNDITEIYAKENSVLYFYSFQNWDNNVSSISNWIAKQEKNSTINYFFGQFGGKISRLKIDNVFNGQGSSSKSKGIFFSTKTQHFDITTNATHVVPNTTSDILVKGVLSDESSSVYRGKIKIVKDAQNTNSYLSDHCLILSENAVSNNIPSLEIDANEVKASHGATIGKPDEEDLFYLMSRGLNKEQAQKTIIHGFFTPIIDSIKISDLKQEVEQILEKKVLKWN